MKMFMVWISVVLFSVGACAASKKQPQAPTIVSVSISPSPAPVASPQPSPSPSLITSNKLTFAPVDYYTTPAERVKIKAAETVVNQVIQSKCFYTFMSTRNLIQTNSRTPVQVAARLQSLSGVVPVQMYTRCMSFNLFKCPSPTTAVAYRNVGDPTIHLNRAWFQTTDSDEEWAATMAHEGVGHALGGYDHDFNWSPSRSFSIPYSLGGADQAQGGDVFDACAK